MNENFWLIFHWLEELVVIDVVEVEVEELVVAEVVDIFLFYFIFDRLASPSLLEYFVDI